jgi:phage terminase large subunit GpA-like protein
MTATANAVEWSAKEKVAWEWPEEITPSQWIERYRVLNATDNADPGPMNLDLTPYARGILDKVVDSTVAEIWCIKGAQVGWSELVRGIIGYWIDAAPGPMFVVLPDEQSTRELVDERLLPLIKETPRLARHMTARPWDIKLESFKLSSMSMYFAWATSSQRVKSKPARYAVLEEPDEFVAHSGAGGNPVDKVRKRLTTYARRGLSRLIAGGTPTTRRGNTWKNWELCGAKMHLWIPCPHCNKYQKLIWGDRKSKGGLKWPELPELKDDRPKYADTIDTQDLAYYQCEHCEAPIREQHKATCFVRQVWVSEEQWIETDSAGNAVVCGPPVRAKRVGFHLPSLCSRLVRFSTLAAEWILAQGDSGAIIDFINQRLGEPYEDKTNAPKKEVIEAKAAAAKHRGFKKDVLPHWTRRLFTTVDSQKAGFWYVIRAWGWRYRSRLVRYGFCATAEEVIQIGLMTPYAILGADGMPAGQFMMPQYVLWDEGGGTENDKSQSRTQEVRRIAERAPGIIIPIKGASHKQYETVRRSGAKDKITGRHIGLHTIDTNRLKDELAMRIKLGVDLETGELTEGDVEGGWELSDAADDEYIRQMLSEHKIVTDPKTGEEGWVKIRSGGDNHLWDDEVYQLAAADGKIGAVNMIPSPADEAAYLAAEAARAKYKPERPDWMPERPDNWTK